MIRLLTLLFGAALIAALAAWVVDQQGELVFLVNSYEVRTSTGVAIGLAIVFTLLVVLLTRLLAAILGTPEAFGRWSFARRQRRGHEALARGLVAAAAGDGAEAKRLAARTHTLLGGSPLALLLTAQAAELEGEESRQSDSYRAMLAHPETELLGLRGLYLKAMREHDTATAMELAARANALGQRSLWAAEALFEQKTARRRWSEAREVLDGAARAGLFELPALRRRRAVLLAAQALDCESRGEGAEALDLALEALALSPALVPVAAMAARRLALQGRAWRAQDILEAAWSAAPHPDLAAAYAAIKPDETAEGRAERLVALAHLNPEHFESRILEAEQAVNLAVWSEARRVLAPLASDGASARVCALMAEIEQGERHDAAAAHLWLSRAARAPRDAEWRCGVCGWTAPAWRAVCGHCRSFDSMAWTAPGRELPPPDEEPTEAGAVAALPPPAKRKDAPVPAEALVILPRRPDDPGPDGESYDTGG